MYKNRSYNCSTHSKVLCRNVIYTSCLSSIKMCQLLFYKLNWDQRNSKFVYKPFGIDSSQCCEVRTVWRNCLYILQKCVLNISAVLEELVIRLHSASFKWGIFELTDVPEKSRRLFHNCLGFRLFSFIWVGTLDSRVTSVEHHVSHLLQYRK